MKPVSPEDTAQAMQRIRVGMTGLAMVLVLIGFASAIFTSANRDGPVTAIGASNASIVANMADGNEVMETVQEDPLAKLGVAPSTGSTETVNAAEIAKRRREAAGKQ
jgi:hypothetical protein